MNVETLTVDRKAALDLWKKYQAHKHGLYSPIDAEIARIAKMVADGKVFVPALAEIARVGVNEQGQPKLAIARADQKVCYLDLMTDGRAIMHNRKNGWDLHRAAASMKFDFPAGTFPTGVRQRRLESIVPHIPPDIRPKRGIQNYHILYEAVWRREIPVDPLLIRRTRQDRRPVDRHGRLGADRHRASGACRAHAQAMIVIVVGTVVGTVLGAVALHYVRVCLRRAARRRPEDKAKELGKL